MIEAVVVAWDGLVQAGTARSTDGHIYKIHYRDGQSFFTSDDQPIPMLTGKHNQTAGGQLKMPEIGDPILVQPPASELARLHWGYMRPYIELVERHYGTRFMSGAQQS